MFWWKDTNPHSPVVVPNMPCVCWLYRAFSSPVSPPFNYVDAATKAAVYSFTESLAMELRESDIRIADVSVGYVASPMVANQETVNSIKLTLFPYVTPNLVASRVWDAVHRARPNREHFFVEYSTAGAFKLSSFSRTLGWRLHSRITEFLCMPRSMA